MWKGCDCMAQRTVCLCDGKYIGIESIYTVIHGQQINIPEKIKELRAKSRNGELYCPCGCGSNLILVAGDKNLKEQHFRLKDGVFNNECHVITEGRVSVASKIVLKCWLDEKLNTADIETRVPVYLIGDTNRKYEFSFLSKDKNVALSYCHERVNLSDEKFEILEENSHGTYMIYVVDAINGGINGQYPEGLMKVQKRQGYCLLLDVDDVSYNEATMAAVFYVQDIDGLWNEIKIAEGYLRDFTIDDNGKILYKNKSLELLQGKIATVYNSWMQSEKARREVEKRRRDKEQQQILKAAEIKRQEQRRKQEEAERERKRRQEEEKKRREKNEAEIKKREEDFRQNMKDNFTQQETQIKDAAGNRWIKCEFCGLIAKESEFTSYGGINHMNLGTCNTCAAKKAAEYLSKAPQTENVNNQMRTKYDASICPECGGQLREKNGQYGSFFGCSNYPGCRFTRKN